MLAFFNFLINGKLLFHNILAGSYFIEPFLIYRQFRACKASQLQDRLGLTAIDVADISHSSILDCSFQTSQGGITNCMWKSSKHPIVPDSFPPEVANDFLDWHVDSTPQEDHLTHGAQEKHFEGLHKLTIYYEKSLHVMS